MFSPRKGWIRKSGFGPGSPFAGKVMDDPTPLAVQVGSLVSGGWVASLRGFYKAGY